MGRVKLGTLLSWQLISRYLHYLNKYSSFIQQYMVNMNFSCHFLRGTGWVKVISVMSHVLTTGRANSFLECANITSTRLAHQVTAAALKILLLKAYRSSNSSLSYEDWFQHREKESQHFKFWSLVLQLQVIDCTLRN